MNPKLILCLALVLGGNIICRADIVYPKAPDGGKEIVSKYLLDAQFLKSLGVSRINDLTIASPYREYYVGTKDLASGRLLSATKSFGWKYPLMHGTNATGSMDLWIDEKKGNTLEFAGLYQTDFSNETQVAIQIAEQWPRIKKQDYEVRRLACPPILFAAIWLHGRSDDIIIPWGATFGRWNALQPYSESQMIKLLKPEAEKKLREPPGMID